YNDIKTKEVNVAKKSQKRGRIRKTDASTSAPRVGPTRIFEAREFESHGLTWFNTQKEAKCAPENWVDEGHLALEFPAVSENIRELRAGYIFNELE
ncbi:hypothetical protein HAX54_034680, partial [Datura stramonium]|nr:hypothetical protein [Datura stramonium]